MTAASELARGRVDIYATDTTGESALSLAEKSGDQRMLDALAPRRDRATDLARANRAVDFGYAIGLRPPPSEPEFKVADVIREETDRARAAEQPAPTPDALADAIERAITALPEGKRKQWAWWNFAIHLYSAGMLARAQDSALQLTDPKMRGDMLISILQHARKGIELERSYEVARREIDGMADPSVRDPLYAQLAHFAGLRGLASAAADTCRAIEAPQFKTGTCHPDARPIAEAGPRVARSEQQASTPSLAWDWRAFGDLQGVWSAGMVMQNGKLHLDRELTSSTWIFRGDDLYIDSELPQKKGRQFSVEVDRRARPNAIHLTSRFAADPDGWMIFAREGDDLKIAYYADLGRRPTGFDAQDGLIVIRLIPHTASAPVAANDGCGILRAAGAYDLIGTREGEQRSTQYPKGGFECRVWRDHDVHLMVTPAAESVFEKRLKDARNAKRSTVKDETGLGHHAYSTTLQSNVSFVAFKDGKIVQLNFLVRGADPARLRQVFGRVLEQI